MLHVFNVHTRRPFGFDTRRCVAELQYVPVFSSPSRFFNFFEHGRNALLLCSIKSIVLKLQPNSLSEISAMENLSQIVVTVAVSSVYALLTYGKKCGSTFFAVIRIMAEPFLPDTYLQSKCSPPRTVLMTNSNRLGDEKLRLYKRVPPSQITKLL